MRTELQQANGPELLQLSEETIAQLVEEFYVKVRAHAELGPYFDGIIQDHWPEHLEIMKKFWSSIALGPGTYHGHPMPIHRALPNAKPEHFTIWLQLFEETLGEVAPNDQVEAFFMGKARIMGERLSRAMFS